ncbi:DUF4190 domain-containing protein [Micrococcus sp. IITD107]|uniref:DUF4190 domain-containing protein n=1 Tax=Micrococcus sp. IITD107 TaxID=3342790 RepID=UPI0035B86891
MSDSSGDHRPFRDPKHPSWYSHPGADSSGSGSSAAQPQNPYAPQSPSGAPGSGDPHYALQGQYPMTGRPRGMYEQDGRVVGQPHPYAGQQSPSLSIVAMVFGILGVLSAGTMFLPQLAAIVLGHIGLRKEPNGRGFAIAGLVMGYVVTFGWILLIVLMMMFAFTVPFMGM